jgi:hypothetical protein
MVEADDPKGARAKARASFLPTEPAREETPCAALRRRSWNKMPNAKWKAARRCAMALPFI